MFATVVRIIFELNVLNIIVNKKKAFSFFSRFHFVFL
jgi:hypothetical protein